MIAVRSPFTGGEARIIDVVDTVTFRGQEFSVASQCYECASTGQHFTDTVQDEAFVQELRQHWRERNSVPTPLQLTTRRKTLGLSGNEMATLLGLGTNQYRLYEKGEFPAESKVRLLQVAMDERALPVLIEGAKLSLSPRALTRLQQHINRQLVGNIHWLAQEHQVEAKAAFSEKVHNIVSRSSTDGGCAHTQAIRLSAQVSSTADKVLPS